MTLEEKVGQLVVVAAQGMFMNEASPLTSDSFATCGITTSEA